MRPELVHAVEVAWSADGRLTRAEGAAQQVFGAPAEALVGRKLSDVLGISTERAAEVQARARAAGATPTVEFVTRQDAGAVAFRLVLAATDDETTAGVMDLGHLLQGAPPLQISNLSSSLSHEIRNPLSSVKMAVQTLQRNTGLSERDQRRLSIANREIRTMERMLGLLSEYGREVPLSLEITPLRQLIQDAATVIAPELAERRTQLEIEEPPETPTARVDSLRLRLVLAQLLLNVAMGHPEGGTVKVKVGPRPGGGGVIEIPDPQSTLPEEERETLFLPFGSRLARGAGLSLAALRHALKAHGGDVTAAGGASPGIRFTLSFPA